MANRLKTRLDRFLVESGFVDSRHKAVALILGGKVSVDGVIVDKPGKEIPLKACVELEHTPKYVSRGGIKLEGALEGFKIDVKNKIAIDVGASTGGFTDCLLSRGAQKVYAVDVGYGQLDWKLRQDSRVVVLERKNIRYLVRDEIADDIDIATIDTSFISLKRVLPKVIEIISDCGEIVAMIKPQFEVGKGEVGKGGVVRDPEKHQRIIEEIKKFSISSGLCMGGILESVLYSPKVNKEFFIYLKKHG